MSTDNHPAIAQILGLHRGIGINPDREDLFRDKFLASLRTVGLKPSQFNPDRLMDTVRFAFEAIRNVYDHANRKPMPRGTAITSCFTLEHPKGLEDLPDPAGRLRVYGERLAALIGPDTSEVPDFIRVSVKDDGNGIAARHTLDPDIYRGSAEAEGAAVREALKARSSVKLAAQDCQIRGTPGYGFTYIQHYLGSLHALGMLHTGRFLAVIDGVDGTDAGFEVVEREDDCVPGTELEALIPIMRQSP